MRHESHMERADSKETQMARELGRIGLLWMVLRLEKIPERGYREPGELAPFKITTKGSDSLQVLL